MLHLHRLGDSRGVLGHRAGEDRRRRMRAELARGSIQHLLAPAIDGFAQVRLLGRERFGCADDQGVGGAGTPPGWFARARVEKPGAQHADQGEAQIRRLSLLGILFGLAGAGQVLQSVRGRWREAVRRGWGRDCFPLAPKTGLPYSFSTPAKTVFKSVGVALGQKVGSMQLAPVAVTASDRQAFHLVHARPQPKAIQGQLGQLAVPAQEVFQE